MVKNDCSHFGSSSSVCRIFFRMAAPLVTTAFRRIKEGEFVTVSYPYVNREENRNDFGWFLRLTEKNESVRTWYPCLPPVEHVREVGDALFQVSTTHDEFVFKITVRYNRCIWSTIVPFTLPMRLQQEVDNLLAAGIPRAIEQPFCLFSTVTASGKISTIFFVVATYRHMETLAGPFGYRGAQKPFLLGFPRTYLSMRPASFVVYASLSRSVFPSTNARSVLRQTGTFGPRRSRAFCLSSYSQNLPAFRFRLSTMMSLTMKCCSIHTQNTSLPTQYLPTYRSYRPGRTNWASANFAAAVGMAALPGRDRRRVPAHGSCRPGLCTVG